VELSRLEDSIYEHPSRKINMLYKLIVAASLIASGDALNVPVAGMSRRAAFAKAAALIPLVPLAAFAELKQASDAEVYGRADAGKLSAARVIERAKAGKLVDGSSANCQELADIIAIDRRAVQFEKDKLASMPNDPAQKKVVADAEKAIEAQIKKLEGLEKSKSCAGLKQASDAEVYERADDNQLGYARVIERAKAGKLVDGSSATCSELEKIIRVDQEAVQFEKDKLEAMPNDPAQKKIVADAEKAIEAQIVKLNKKRAEKKCN
jgi:hypothetical protein